MSMSKAELARLAELEKRIEALEQRAALHAERDIMDGIGADHEEHTKMFPRKTLTLKAKPSA